jgi:hypothetical protein
MFRALLTLASLAVPLALGWFLNDILIPRRLPGGLRASLAIGTGLGARSVLLFWWMLTVGRGGRSYAVVEIVLATVVFGFAKWRRPLLRNNNDDIRLSLPEHGSLDWLLVSCFVLLLLLGVAGFFSMSVNAPHGGWDAWAIWNMHARFLFRGGAAWRSAFAIKNSVHPDYPLLLPEVIAGSWFYVGSDTILVPVAVAFLFTFGTVGAIVSVLATLRNTTQALLGGIVILGTPYFLLLGAYQDADVPLGYYLLLALSTLAIYRRANNKALLALSGAYAGFAAWTKNEGLLMLLAIGLAVAASAILLRETEALSQQFVAIGKGVLLPILSVFYFKAYIAPKNGLMASQAIRAILHQLMDFRRYVEVTVAFVKAVTLGSAFGLWTVNLIPVLLFYALLMGARATLRERVTAAVPTLAVTLIVLGYHSAYLLSPWPVAWQVHYALGRLLTQVWPSVVLLCFLFINSPREAFESSDHGVRIGPR